MLALKKHTVDHLLTDMAGRPFAQLASRKQPEGQTIAAFLAEAGWHEQGMPTICVINGQPVSRGIWNVRLIAENDNVEFWSRPGNMGGAGGAGGAGGSKSLIAVIGLVAATVLLPMLAPAIGGVLGVSVAAVKAWTTVLLAAGSLLLSWFNQPKAGATDTSNKQEIYSISADGNSARPMQPIPVGYGRRINAPDFCATPYSEFEGDDQILYELFAIGCGEYQIEEMLLDDTPFWTRSGGVSSDFPTIKVQIVEPGENVTLFPVNVVTASEVSNIDLHDQNVWVGPFIVNPAGTEANQLWVDLVWSGGLYTDWKGQKKVPAQTSIECQYREVNAAGAPIGTWQQLFVKDYVLLKTNTLRITEKRSVPKGRYEVRLRRTDIPRQGSSWNEGRASTVDNVAWSSVRARIDGPRKFPGVTTVALEVKADQTLSGMSSRRIKVIATRKLPVWNGASWTTKATRNPVWAALDVWTNTQYSAGLSYSQTDLATFKAYADFYDENNIYFDHYFTSEMSIYEALEICLKAGRAAPAFIGDRLTMVRDAPRGLPRQLFTDKEIIRGSLQVHRKFVDDEFADGVVLEYLDETTWQMAEVASADNLEKPAIVRVDGVCNRPQAFDLACYYAAANRYRRRTVTFQVELEGRMLKRGDLISVQSNVPRTWGTSASVVAYDPATKRITVDRDLTFSSNGGVSHYVEFRRADGRPFGPVKVSRAITGNNRVLVCDTVDLAKVEGEQFITLAEVLARTADMDPPSIAFSMGIPRAFKCLVTRGTSSGNLMEIEAVIDDPRVYVAADGKPVPPIPDSVLQPPKAMPVIKGLAGYIRQQKANAVLQAGWERAARAVDYVAQISYDNETWVTIYTGTEISFMTPMATPADCWLRVAGRTANNQYGAWYKIQIDSPDIVLSNDYITMRFDENDLRPRARRVLEFQPQYTPIADVAANSIVLAQAASNTASAAVIQTTQVKADLESALAAYKIEVTAQFGEIEGYVDTQITALTGPTGAITNLQTQLNAVTGPGGPIANITEELSLVNDKFTGIAASYLMVLNTNGYLTGFQLVAELDTPSSEPISEMRVLADKFLVGGGGAPGRYVFGVTTVGGVAQVTINGSLIASGTIGADRLEAPTLSAIRANLGTVTAGAMQSADGDVVFNLNTKRLEFWD